MTLNEFFSKPMEIQNRGKEETSDKMKDELYWYILDHDKLHKDYFFPIAKQLKGMKECDDNTILELYMPLVIKACREFHKQHKLAGKLGKEFPKKMREELCRRLHDHFFNDIKSDKYKLG